MAFATTQQASWPEIKKVLKFKSSTKTFQYWDKDQQKVIDIKLPIKFSFVANSAKFTGFHKTDETPIYSNEIHSLKEDQLTVKTSKWWLIAIWLYADVKTQVNNLGWKYTTVIYWLWISEGIKDELFKMEISWAALSSLINDKIKLKWDIWISELWEGKKWVNKYSFPIFENLETKYSTDRWNIIADYCNELEEAYKEKKWQKININKKSEEIEKQFNDIIPSDIKPEDLPF